MALQFQQLKTSFPDLSKTFTRPLPILSPSRVCITHRLSAATITAVAAVSDQTIVRRSGNYGPTTWQNEYIQSLRSEFGGEECNERINMLMGEVRVMLNRSIEEYPLELLKLIDVLKRLGLSYHFENEINKILEGMYNRSHDDNMWAKNDLYATALRFRLLRQHGFNIPQEVFSRFTDDLRNFKACFCEDINGMLALYEASYLSLEGECILDEAKDFSTKHLREYLKWSKEEQTCALVTHSLEIPLHWRMPRWESRWFIDAYRRKEDKNSNLLELAILDFNKVQSIHQEDLKHASAWWKSSGLGEKLSFARDRLVPNFLWTLGMRYEPEFGYCRRTVTRVDALLTAVDDIYDVYGTLDELELFTNAIERWDINAMDQLPDYMKICFLSVFNTVNEIAFNALREKGVHVVQYLKKTWANQCRSYLKEARWYHNKYTPTLEEYMDNGWISVTVPVILTHTYVCSCPITNKIMESLVEEYPDFLRLASMIIRLEDDLGTSLGEMKRGDVPKSIQCYMNETGVSEEDARKHVRYLIYETWKKLNKAGGTNSRYPQDFVEIAKNITRMAQYLYEDGSDGHGLDEDKTKDRVSALLIHPLSLHS